MAAKNMECDVIMKHFIVDNVLIQVCLKQQKRWFDVGKKFSSYLSAVAKAIIQLAAASWTLAKKPRTSQDSSPNGQPSEINRINS